ncbi:hypothetical protein GJ688_13010 [Heliobacillus mobilis]|uniref:Uncharacterized protein n=1 Tax=Heliobacterium mobile TaxID=28064 RepID=A0A6I3SLR9_HELMO|nr:hypothetical protein [Heliobacterium mobile]MTV49893.1 hypothetical protein [Heliobacterium mobile]
METNLLIRLQYLCLATFFWLHMSSTDAAAKAAASLHLQSLSENSFDFLKWNADDRQEVYRKINANAATIDSFYSGLDNELDDLRSKKEAILQENSFPVGLGCYAYTPKTSGTLQALELAIEYRNRLRTERATSIPTDIPYPSLEGFYLNNLDVQLFTAEPADWPQPSEVVAAVSHINIPPDINLHIHVELLPFTASLPGTHSHLARGLTIVNPTKKRISPQDIRLLIPAGIRDDEATLAERIAHEMGHAVQQLYFNPDYGQTSEWLLFLDIAGHFPYPIEDSWHSSPEEAFADYFRLAFVPEEKRRLPFQAWGYFAPDERTLQAYRTLVLSVLKNAHS